MPDRQAQDLPFVAFFRLEHFRQQFGRHGHHRRHPAGKLDPHGILRRQAMLLAHGSALAHDLGEVLVVLHGLGQIQKSQRAPQVRRGTLIQKHRRVAGQGVAVAILGQKAVNHQEIAQNAGAARRSLAPGGYIFRRLLAFADGREQTQFDGRSQRFRFMKSVRRLKKQLWRGRWTDLRSRHSMTSGKW
jgi:hypothetical protein